MAKPTDGVEKGTIKDLVKAAVESGAGVGNVTLTPNDKNK